MNIIPNPPYDDIKKFGVLAYVPVSERNRVLGTMTTKGIHNYCEWLQKQIDIKRRGK